MNSITTNTIILAIAVVLASVSLGTFVGVLANAARRSGGSKYRMLDPFDKS
jgi:hypothetical protein